MGPQLDSCGRNERDEIIRLDIHASMGPQLDSCGRFTSMPRCSLAPETLQWGRNLIVAEGIRPTMAHTVRNPSLQWGRNLIVAEGCRRAKASPPYGYGLQWGRNLIVAEGAK